MITQVIGLGSDAPDFLGLDSTVLSCLVSREASELHWTTWMGVVYMMVIFGLALVVALVARNLPNILNEMDAIFQACSIADYAHGHHHGYSLHACDGVESNYKSECYFAAVCMSDIWDCEFCCLANCLAYNCKGKKRRDSNCQKPFQAARIINKFLSDGNNVHNDNIVILK